MIEKMTTAQEKHLSIYCDKWLEIGLSIEDTDLEKAVSALKIAYSSVGLTAPTKIEHYDSPFEAIDEMKLRYNINVDATDFVYGAHDAAWLSYYNYFGEVIGIKQCESLHGLMEFAKYSGWALLFDELIVLTRRPIEINFDEENRAHSESGYAIKFKDGTGVAVWHGTSIPSKWIFNKSTITTDVMFKWENVEQRRCACEIIGWATVLEQLSAITIDKDNDPTIGTLLEVNLPDSGKERFLLAADPNVDKKVGIPVPYEMETALEANSWTYGIDKFEFKPDFRV